MVQTVITKGHARLTHKGLRCCAPREGAPRGTCQKLVVMPNAAGQIAGNFLCPERRCRQEIEVEIRISRQ